MNFHFNSTSLSNGVLIDIHSDKGGVGKTFFTDSLKAFLTSMGIACACFASKAVIRRQHASAIS